MMRRKLEITLLFILLPFITAVLWGGSALAANSPAIVELTGKVTDNSGNGIENAVVSAVGTGVSSVLTDAQGNYKFYLVGQESLFTLQVSKAEYNSEVSGPMTPAPSVHFDAVLGQGSTITVVRENFVTNSFMSGKVYGLNAEDTATHKVLMYVLTDKWYIHPYAENTEGKGFARINNDGSWRIQTVNRRHNPFKLAIMVVPADTIPPAAILSEGDAEGSLKVKFGQNLKAIQIINMPKGL